MFKKVVSLFTLAAFLVFNMSCVRTVSVDVEKVEKFALSRGKERMILHTAERLVNARKLYEKSGYILERATKTSPPHEFTVMTYKKDLLSEKEK